MVRPQTRAVRRAVWLLIIRELREGGVQVPPSRPVSTGSDQYPPAGNVRSGGSTAGADRTSRTGSWPQLRSGKAPRRHMERCGRMVIVTHAQHEDLSRTVWITFHRRGITSSVSVPSSPSFDSLDDPQQGQLSGAGIPCARAADEQGTVGQAACTGTTGRFVCARPPFRPPVHPRSPPLPALRIPTMRPRIPIEGGPPVPTNATGVWLPA
jgi:hypothetical protein